MGAWEVKGPAKGACRSWRDVYPELAEKVTRIRAPVGRAIWWEGTEMGLSRSARQCFGVSCCQHCALARSRSLCFLSRRPEDDLA